MNYHVVRTDDMLNGSGLRVVLFVSGCNHHCPECHNPETWDKDSGQLFDDNAIEEILKELNNNYISGLTLSGGDPLNYSNLPDVYELIKVVKEKCPNKNIWIYTGFTWDSIYHPVTDSGLDDLYLNLRKAVANACDVLVDGRFIKDLADVNYPWCGSTNQRVIDVKKSLEANEVILYKGE